jgi:glycosyltransferase involved in cell wall biosynthesis
VIGEGSEADTLQSMARDLKIADSVHFLAYRKDAQRLTAAANVMALSSRWEKMPLVLGEAMMSGVPVVSTPWTGVDAFMADGQTGFISADWSVEAFTSTLARAIDDGPLRDAIGARGREVALERFDIRRTVRLHAELYRQLTSGLRAVPTKERLTGA